MSRPLRIEFPGALYHVTSRGNARQDVYLCDKDKKLFLYIIAEVIKRYNWICHAYCLMDNHYHLIIETPDGNLSKGMRQLNGIYTQTFNNKYKRVGHLFQGRYKAILVDKASYLLELSRYVVLNPVRAKMVGHPKQYKWSSYNATAGINKEGNGLTVDWLLRQFAERRAAAQKKYAEFVQEGKTIDIWNSLNKQIYLGDERFINRVLKKIKKDKKAEDLREIPKQQRSKVKKTLVWYEERYRDKYEAMVRAYQSGLYSLKEIADYYGVHYSTVSRAVKRSESKK